jgi:pyruvate dehydrogenase E1 component
MTDLADSLSSSEANRARGTREASEDARPQQADSPTNAAPTNAVRLEVNGSTSPNDPIVLERIQDRVLWLATSMIHHANKVRPNRSGLKVGGHQASSASIVSIMTALYFEHLRAEDRVSVKPHASPILHAINAVLGRLDPSYLTELRSFNGLQSYPSRTKDPDPVDFSTGSVGIGATATIWSAIAKRYVNTHYAGETNGRHVALLGDAELDEGAIWEALVDPMTHELGELLWVVDLNRQSLDRVVPDIAAGRIGAMFNAAGWQSIVVKYGRWLQELFARRGGEELRARIDNMSNEEYQRLLRSPADEARERLMADRITHSGVQRVIDELTDNEVLRAVRDLGGHDLAELREAYRTARASTDRPTVVFAYTIKAWKFPTQGHPSNHSALLTNEQYATLAQQLGADSNNPFALFEPNSVEARRCTEVAARLTRPPIIHASCPKVPASLNRKHNGQNSTQQAFGRVLTDLAHEAPEVAKRVVTVSPDVASSTNLGGWINKVGVWNMDDRTDWFADDNDTILHWTENSAGQHIELGIAEGNLVGLLGELGATWSRDGEPLFPIGTIYDPFVTRALEPWSFGMYAGGQSILVGTPSGITLAPEGGAHQSIITPSIGIEQPQCVAWEPAYSQDLEWCLLHAIDSLGKPDGTSAYFRLSTRMLEQPSAVEGFDGSQRRHEVLSGGYAIRRAAEQPKITLVGVGAMMPEVLEASQRLAALDVATDVICLSSPDLIFRAVQARSGLGKGDANVLTRLFPADRAVPIVTVLDGHPHTLAFLGTINNTPIANLGVQDFGRSGDLDDLYAYFGIDAPTIVGAAFDLLY